MSILDSRFGKCLFKSRLLCALLEKTFSSYNASLCVGYKWVQAPCEGKLIKSMLDSRL